MPSEHKHKTAIEMTGDQICECLPEQLRNDKKFVYRFGQLCGFAAGWIVGKTIIELLFPRGDKK